MSRSTKDLSQAQLCFACEENFVYLTTNRVQIHMLAEDHAYLARIYLHTPVCCKRNKSSHSALFRLEHMRAVLRIGACRQRSQLRTDTLSTDHVDRRNLCTTIRLCNPQDQQNDSRPSVMHDYRGLYNSLTDVSDSRVLTELK